MILHKSNVQLEHERVKEYLEKTSYLHYLLFIDDNFGVKASSMEFFMRMHAFCKEYHVDMIIFDSTGCVVKHHILYGVSLHRFPVENYISVISLQPNYKKLTTHTTLLANWHNVPHLLSYLSEVCTYDSYLSSYSIVADKFIQSITPANTPFYGFFNRSLPMSMLLPIRKNMNHLKLAFVGNFYENRDLTYCIYNDNMLLLKALDHKGLTRLYGSRKLYSHKDVLTWNGFRTYSGHVPHGVNESSSNESHLLQEIHQCGIALVLFTRNENRSELISMQFLEAIAAGVPIICNSNPSIVEWFGKYVFMITGQTVEEKVESIIQHMNFIAENPIVAYEKVRLARSVFRRTFSWDVQISTIINTIRQEEVIQQKCLYDKVDGELVIDA